MINNKITNRQSFAVFCASGFDVRNCGLTVEQAKTLLGKLNSPDREIAIAEISKLDGAIQKKKVSGANASNYQAIYNEAHSAGMTAGASCQPAPMMVQEHVNPLNDNSPVKQSWFVADGPCGFAQTIVRGNNGFVKWLRKNNMGYKNYYGGYAVPCHAFNQSIARKEAYCAAFADVLKKHGFDAYMSSRLD